MKLAVLADIHANLVALEAVADHIKGWIPDQVVVAGDTINRGPRPQECLKFVLEKGRTEGWLTVRGNHEDYVIDLGLPGAPRAGPALDVHRGSYWTCRQLQGDVTALLAMPFQQTLSPGPGGEVRVVHASMRGNRDGIYPHTRDDTLREQIQPSVPLFCVGHTHRPLIRWLDETLVVNVGSVGLPFDGDRRAAYAQLSYGQDGWKAEIARIEYNYAEAEQDFFESGFMEGAGPLAELVLVELRQAKSQLFQWASIYQSLALAGEITMEDSVREFLGK